MKKPDTFTENSAPSYSTTTSALVDFFFGSMVRGAPCEKVENALAAAWAEDPERALKIVLHGRNCRGGKGEKEVCISSMMWLRRNKPKTYALNLRAFLETGYYKDLLQIAARSFAAKLPVLGKKDFLELELMAHDLLLDEEHVLHPPAPAPKKPKASSATSSSTSSSSSSAAEEPASKKSKKKGKKKDKPTEEAEAMDVDEKKDEKKEEKADEKTDEKADEKKDGEGKKGKKRTHVAISLAAKWAPSEKSHFDKADLGRLAFRLAKLLDPKTKAEEKTEIESGRPVNEKALFMNYRHRLAALRQHLKLVESLMCSGKWDQINFGAVPSRAHNIYKKAFAEHDPERYTKYQEDLKEGKAKINVQGLQPHEISKQYMTKQEVDEIAEAQWRTMMDKLKAAGKLNSAMAVCDVSGSMSGIPMEVCIALGLIVSELVAGPYNGKIITFETTPHLIQVEGKNLMEKVQHMQRMPWGGSTDVLAVFKLILDVALKNKVPAAQLPRTLFIFSDMQFNCANGGGNQMSTHQEAEAMFTQAGYKLPQIVYWNLRGDTIDFPTDANTPGVALVSGFSADLLKLFMEDMPLNARAILELALKPYTVQIDPSEKQINKTQWLL